MKTYAVTGINHGSIITCKNKREARRIFRIVYNGESILIVKDISDYPLENL